MSRAIDRVWVIVTVDDDGNEVPHSITQPPVKGQPEKEALDRVRSQAQELCGQTKRTTRVIELTYSAELNRCVYSRQQN